jgi:hypothetical protein
VSERIEQLRLAVETMHHCKASHEASTPIRETFCGQTVWEGVVESFALTGHAKAKRCYAWSFQDNGETQYVTALEVRPVESPITAVRASIVADAKKRKNMKDEWTLRFFLPEKGEQEFAGSGDQNGASLKVKDGLKNGWILEDMQQNGKSVEACRLLKLLNDNGVKLIPN